MKMDPDAYNVKKYTDVELFELMDLTHPSDRELEARIIQLIRKYSIIHNQSGRLIKKFFEDVYDHFFDNEEEDDDEDDDEDDGNPVIEAMTEPEKNNEPSPKQPQQPQQPLPPPPPLQPPQLQPPLLQPPPTPTPPTQPPQVRVNQLEYTRDKLNPLLKQTVKRIVSIDSQFRDEKYPLSTEFTFNLSEPLRDVVALRLYSIHIPVTWYTISNNFGGNFFILKGNAPGILDNPSFEYKVEIASGNYTAENLAVATNASIQALKNTYTDVSFGDTKLTYNPINSLATMKVEIQNVFNENKYQLQFAEWSSPIETDSSGVALRYKGDTTLPAYLGFNAQTYDLNQIRSQENLPLIENSLAEDTNNAIYTLDACNNYFDIIQYQGPAEYTPSTPILNTIRIQLKLEGQYSRNAIVSEINTRLQSDIYLQNSGITRTNITDPNIDNFGHSYYTITVNLNKTNTLSGPSLKTAILFPIETTGIRIWTQVGASPATPCALLYRDIVNEFSNLIAETETLQTNYIVKSRPYIVYKCIAPGYTNPYNMDKYQAVTDICFNDYKIQLPVSPEFGWSFAEYLQVINASYNQTNDATKDGENPNGVFNMTNTGIYNNTNLSKIFFRSDINRIFLKQNYIIDLSGSSLFTILGIGQNVSPSGANIDLSINSILTSTTSTRASYRIETDNIAVIYPKSGTTNANAAPWVVPPVAELTTGQTLQAFIGYVNASFQNFQDANGSNPLSETSLTATLLTETTVLFTLNVRVSKALTESDYQIQFYDLSLSSGTINLSTNYWDFENNSGLVSFPKIGAISLTGTTDASYSTFTHTGGGSATNVGAPPTGTVYGFIASNPVIPSTDDWTINLWYYSTLTAEDENQVLFSQYSPTIGILFKINNNLIELTINGIPVISVPFTESIQNSWHMYSVIRSNNTYSIYYDGALYANETIITSFIILQTNFAIGIYGNARGYWDEVALWKSALTGEQLADIYSPFIWQNTINNSWFNFLKIGDPSYNLIDYKVPSSSFSDIYGISVISGFTYTITEDTSFVLLGNAPGVADASSSVIVNIPASPFENNQYTRQQLFNIINDALSANPLSAGSFVGVENYGGTKEYVKFRININQIYTAKDYRLVFYDPFSFVKCYIGIKSVRNATWDSTLGWILGFRETTEYVLSDYGTTNPITIVGDTAVTTNLYNYFLIVLDDYTQSHLNDGLVTVTQQENDIALPSYASRTKITCDSNGDPVFNDPNLTQNQIYAANQIIQAKQNRKRYTNPTVQDVFALIPMKTGGLANGSSYIEFGGTLQNQERTYFGPVNIHRMNIKLVNDRGDVVDLNGSNWSFSLVCEQLYQQKSV